MPFAQYLLFNIPPVLLGIIVVAIFISISIFGLITVRKYISHQRLKIHNDVAGPIFGTLGMAYTVLIAFVFVTVWQGFDRASTNVERESNCLVDLYRDAEAFQPEFKKEVRMLCIGYGKAVITDEWKTIARGEASLKVHEVLKDMWTLYSGYSPKTDTEKIFFEESVRKLNELGELRRSRIIDSRSGIPPILWFVLIVGGITTVVFTFFFGSENLKAQILMTVMLSILISLILFTILLFDIPFTGGVGISPKAFYPMLRP